MSTAIKTISWTAGCESTSLGDVSAAATMAGTEGGIFESVVNVFATV